MRKIVAIIGSPRKGETYRAVKQFEENLRSHGNILVEYVFLSDQHIEPCRGCFLCLMKGEEFCPHKDDLSEIVRLISGAHGVIFAVPNYSLQVPGLMKKFLDRLAYVFHRPRFFHKAFIPIVTQGVFGGEDIVKYLQKVARFWGFNVTRGVLLTTPPGMRLPTEEKLIDRRLERAAKRFHDRMGGDPSPSPDIRQFAIFRFLRSMYVVFADDSSVDYRYFRDKGWLSSEYYYPVTLNPFVAVFGRLLEAAAVLVAIRQKKERQQMLPYEHEPPQ